LDERTDQFAGMHRIREMQSLAMHRRIAVLLAERPDVVIGKALGNLARWMEGLPVAEVPTVYLEWKEMLSVKNPNEIAMILISEDEDAVRLRQSSPFAGVLDAREVWRIKRTHEAA
jgi:hypothetical protein